MYNNNSDDGNVPLNWLLFKYKYCKFDDTLLLKLVDVVSLFKKDIDDGIVPINWLNDKSIYSNAVGVSVVVVVLLLGFVLLDDKNNIDSNGIVPFNWFHDIINVCKLI